jgi:hypothetical protein
VEATLGRSAQAFAGAVTEGAKVLVEGLRESAKVAEIPFPEARQDDLLALSLVFVLHATNRFALRFLAISGRALFMDALLEKLTETVDRASFREAFNKTELEYAKCRDFLPAKDEGFGGTVCWEFAKRARDIICPDRPEAAVYFTMAASQTVLVLGKTFTECVPIT